MSLHKGKSADLIAALGHAHTDLQSEASLNNLPGGLIGGDIVARQLNELSAGNPYGRSEIAAFMLENGPRIRRRVRGKLGEMLRRTVDSEDILSTVIRRLDCFAASGRLRAASEGELWALVTKITDAALADKVRKKQRQDPLNARIAMFGKQGVNPCPEARFDGEASSASPVAHDLVEALVSTNKSDAEIAILWARGLSHSAIAASTGQDANEVRSRWQLIKRFLRRKRGT